MQLRFLIPLTALAWCPPVAGDVSLPALFSDHMVLQRAANVPVWGKAGPGEHVTVQLGGAAAETHAAADGRWIVRLNLANHSAGPFRMRVSGSNEIAVQDVVVGSVWLASGQSNMEHALKATIDSGKEIRRSANAQLRQFKVDKVAKPEPADDCKGRWVVAGPETSGDFSAVAYYFGKNLQNDLHLPVGIINASWSGTFSEMWISADSIDRVEELRNGEEARRKATSEFPAKKAAFVAQFAAWLKESGREDRPSSYAAESNDGWRAVPLPGAISPVPGAFWIRKDLDIPPEAAGPNQDFKVLIGKLEGYERVYWNGALVSETPYQKFPGQGYPRYFPIPKPLLKAGVNTIAVRVYAPALPPAITIDPPAFKAGPVSMAGDWLMKTEYELPAVTPGAIADVPRSPAQPPSAKASGIFNGVIHPIVPYALSGILWYQGESDAPRAKQYQIAFPLLIRDWREKWGQPELPFYFCQLPGFGPKENVPGESEWAELREAQAKALALPGTAQAVLIDLGESNDIHPRRKREMGDRLARIVLAKQFHRPVVDSGPVFRSMSIHGEKATLKFGESGGDLAVHKLPETYDVSTLMDKTAPLIRNSPRGELEGFSICGEDRKWYWANARVSGANTVLVWSDRVPRPVAVRYAWADNPTVNLFNGAGLPAAPFRTDRFPGITAESRYGPEN